QLLRIEREGDAGSRGRRLPCYPERGGVPRPGRKPPPEADMAENERAFAFLRVNRREGKPRARGVTEVRGPYYTPLGKRYLADLLETMGTYVDTLKFGGGSFALYSRQALRELIELCHAHQVQVATGGFLEYVLTQGPAAVESYLAECKELG